VLETILQAGARSAGPGEFSQRAFLNGKMDLTQAEAVMDLISAQTTLALRAAQQQLEGRLGREIHRTRTELLGILAHLEAYIDFPEEDIDPATGAALRARMEAVSSQLDQLLATADQGRILRQGARTVICGAPNAGKSSLLNFLLGFERAIVSEIPGTTRDTIEEVINLRGLPLRLVDTAGMRATEDLIEQQGVARSAAALVSADVILEMVDASEPAPQRISLPADATRHRLLLLNKADLGVHPDWKQSEGCEISCHTGSGMEALSALLFQMLTSEAGALGADLVAINTRHQACLQQARALLQQALAESAQGASAEFIALEVRAAMDAVGDVIGRLDTEDLLGEIFSSFCIGK
jgi:tRNA modification GTPase